MNLLEQNEQLKTQIDVMADKLNYINHVNALKERKLQEELTELKLRLNAVFHTVVAAPIDRPIAETIKNEILGKFEY
jgi:hypothetical protein